MRATENSVPRALAGRPRRAPCGARRGPRAARPSASARPCVVAGLDEQAGLAVGDDLGDGAHARRDDRQAGEHRLEQHDPEPLPARRVHEDVRALEPVADVGAARQGHGVVELELGDEPPRLGLERAAAEDREPCLRHRRADARERAQQRRVVLLLDQPADGERERRVRRDPRGGRRRLRRRRPAARRARSGSSPASPGRGPRARGSAAPRPRSRSAAARAGRRRGRRSGTGRAGSGRRCGGSRPPGSRAGAPRAPP